MSRLLFSKNEVENLRTNKYVKKVSLKAITYTDEFKVHFIAESENKKQSKVTFEEADISVEVVGYGRISSATARWKKAYKEKGVMGLMDTRKGNSGRPLERKLTDIEIIERKDAEIAYLRSELSIVKKLDLNESQVRDGNLESRTIFPLIEKLIEKYSLKK